MTNWQNRFAQWWHNIGSGIIPLDTEDMEEHAHRVAEKAYAAGVIDGAKIYGTGRTEPDK